jgi:hypothetical protein
MKRPADSEFDTIIDDLAKMLAEITYSNDMSKYNRVLELSEKARAQYVSSVSPDRKTLAQEAMQAFNKGSNSIKKTADEPKTLIDYLNMRDGVGQPSSEGRYSIALKSGSMIITGSDLEPTSFTLKCGSSGQAVLSHDKHGWAYILTPQERTLQTDFLNRFNSKVDQYYRQYLSSSTEGNDKSDFSNSPANSKHIEEWA